MRILISYVTRCLFCLIAGLSVNVLNAQTLPVVNDTLLYCGVDQTVLTTRSGATNILWNTGESTHSITANFTGNYSYTATYAGASIKDSVYVGLLNAGITTRDTTVCPGQSVSLTVDINAGSGCSMDITDTGINPGDSIPGFDYTGFHAGHYYYVGENATSWIDAELLCRQNGGYLVCINDLAENSFVANMTNHNIWIGLFRDTAGTCEFRWLNCIDIDYTNWRNNEPSDGPCGEPYVQLLQSCSPTNQWNNLVNRPTGGFCYNNLHPVLEIDPSVLPNQPTSILWSTGDTTTTINVAPFQTTDYWVQITKGTNVCFDTITVEVRNPDTTIVPVVSCQPSYTWINDTTYTSPNNTAKYTLINQYGCDSVLVLNLSFGNNAGLAVVSSCGPYTWIDGNTYTSNTNTLTYTLTNSKGCDSLITLNLTTNITTSSTNQVLACDSYTWIDGNTYTTSNNTATATLVNAAGCDSVVFLDLTILQSTSGSDVITACDSYTWIDGNTYTTSNNTATDTLVNAAGCDSVVFLDLTILQSSSGSDVITACDSYTWIDGNTYTTSNNTATDTLVNAAGCDSVVFLDLTILQSSSGSDVITACDSYTWIDGNTYTTSNNTATDTLVNAAGCDSVVFLDLTIVSSTTGIDHVNTCGPYTWIDGNTYNTSNNTATYTLTNADGCDSVITLNLDVNYTSAGVDFVTACDSYTWLDGITYYSSTVGPYVNLLNSQGCDSTVYLNLFLGRSYLYQEVDSAVLNYTWAINNVTYNETGLYSYNLYTAEGCDSLLILDLKILPPTKVWVANSFTPNNDGKNEFFFPVFQGVREMHFLITDRWGNIMFRTSDMNSYGWDGTFKGEPMPEGVYNWYLELRYRTGKYHDAHGCIYLLR